MSEDTLQHGDPFDDPLWKVAEKTARAKRRQKRNKVHVGCPMWWLKWALSRTRSAEQLALALYVYRQRIVQRGKTIRLSNAALEKDLGLSRYSKYRCLTQLEKAGMVTVERRDGRSVMVTLLR
jgi:DNA-binding transcriptional ArsR family regulator